MSGHPNTLVGQIEAVGARLDDLLPAYPGLSAEQIDEVLRDGALALSRPVMAYGLLGVHPCRTATLNVHPAGFRDDGSGQAWPNRDGIRRLFVFGGSTTFGFNVSDGDTVPARLGARLSEAGLDGWEVYNFGSGSYTSRHEMLRFLALLDQGIRPDMALFLDGYNDSFYAFGNPRLVEALDGLYQGEKRRRRMGLLSAVADYWREARTVRSGRMPSVADYSAGDSAFAAPLITWDAVEAALAASSRPADDTAFGAPGARVAGLVWDRYGDSVAMIRAAALRHRIPVVFAWQPVPFFATEPGQRILDPLHRLFRAGAFCAPVYHWLHTNGFPGMGDAPDFVDLSEAGKGLDAVAYLDVCHYTRAMADRIAQALVAQLAPRM
ncbi:hypothetical protein CCC_00842 [Paramagnetospirillum magnetotacticum MS-1]|uniref:SGNH hydrolase-type esterase domain-containing protein n=1 Tax=Paramagnetospirillum magnetotacticum MS-1 TaxID=272627 RepID=A0A0C2UY99_PARME|nr:SGNH/GDSL hydrolase family protein [Paramagnetospirillum magnetotacticum]KIL97781.1 hypothetical protein CCC_00842 [Paramagnetospirillum magnetotacticum MS-1]